MSSFINHNVFNSFNLRDLSRVYEGLCIATTDNYTTQNDLIRLWRNECDRIFFDRLTIVEDHHIYNTELKAIITEIFPESLDAVMVEPLMYGDFESAVERISSEGQSEDLRLYKDLGGYDQVRTIFGGVLDLYASENKAMTLVLFEQALEHLCRIHRIIRNPRGNALLVGLVLDFVKI